MVFYYPLFVRMNLNEEATRTTEITIIGDSCKQLIRTQEVVDEPNHNKKCIDRH